MPASGGQGASVWLRWKSIGRAVVAQPATPINPADTTSTAPLVRLIALTSLCESVQPRRSAPAAAAAATNSGMVQENIPQEPIWDKPRRAKKQTHR
jgi:hypothetical protein